MPRRLNWFWIIYLTIYVPVQLIGIAILISPTSYLHKYYACLVAFDIRFFVPVATRTLMILFNLISLLAVLQCTPAQTPDVQHRFFSPAIWKWLLALRLLNELPGRAYEITFFSALFQSDSTITLVLALSLILVSVPSYLAMYLCTRSSRIHAAD